MCQPVADNGAALHRVVANHNARIVANLRRVDRSKEDSVALPLCHAVVDEAIATQKPQVLDDAMGVKSIVHKLKRAVLQLKEPPDARLHSKQCCAAANLAVFANNAARVGIVDVIGQSQHERWSIVIVDDHVLNDKCGVVRLNNRCRK
jgi:hypothetical protein